MTVVLTITGALSFISFPLIGDPLAVPYSSPPRNASAITQPVRKESSGQVFRQGDDGITRPVVLQRVDPQYSDSAREARIQGTVVLEGIVETDGSMTVGRVARGLDPELDHNAVYALEQWRFTPATKNGAPVRFVLAIEVNFNVK
jgi:TonB family protein